MRREAAQKLLQGDLLADHPFAEFRQQEVPIGIAAVELSQFVMDAHVSSIGDKGCIAQVGRDRVNRPASWSVTASVFLMS